MIGCDIEYSANDGCCDVPQYFVLDDMPNADEGNQDGSPIDSMSGSFNDSCDSPVFNSVIKQEEDDDDFAQSSAIQPFFLEEFTRFAVPDEHNGVPNTPVDPEPIETKTKTQSNSGLTSLPDETLPAVKTENIPCNVMSQGMESSAQQERPQTQAPPPPQTSSSSVPPCPTSSLPPLSLVYPFPFGLSPTIPVTPNSEPPAKLSAAERHKYRRRQKLLEQVGGSSPLPPGMLPPAILGGELPPRVVHNPDRRRHVFTPEELVRRHKKGLADDSDSESEERRLVRLPRPSLLAITTPQMTHYVKYLRATVDLSPSMLDELCKQKRQVKNRESSSRFRAKKDVTLTELKTRIAQLEKENAKLMRENRRLRGLDDSPREEGAAADEGSYADSEDDMDEFTDDQH